MSNGGIFRHGIGAGGGKFGLGFRWERLSITRVLALLLGSALTSHALPTWAETPEPIPPEIRAAADRLETAANERNLGAVMDLYSSDFEHDDGFNRRQLRSAIGEFWDGYISLIYDIEVLTWTTTDTGYMTETETTITGQTLGERPYRLESVVRSRQTFIGDRVVQQTTLEEASTLSAGSNPPTVRVQLPDSVAPGDRFEFDAIVLEPLGDDFLLGGVLEEFAELDSDATFIELAPLSAGGLFKTGTAPEEDEDLWISGALVRKDGITIVTQRLPVTTDRTP